VVREVRDLMSGIILAAIDTDEPTEKEQLVTEILQEVWLSSLVAWISGVEPTASVNRKLEPPAATRLAPPARPACERRTVDRARRPVADPNPRSAARVPEGVKGLDMPLGRRVRLDGRGTTFVREVAGPSPTPPPSCSSTVGSHRVDSTGSTASLP
jgi:hypothetical protein